MVFGKKKKEQPPEPVLKEDKAFNNEKESPKVQIINYPHEILLVQMEQLKVLEEIRDKVMEE